MGLKLHMVQKNIQTRRVACCLGHARLSLGMIKITRLVCASVFSKTVQHPAPCVIGRQLCVTVQLFTDALKTFCSSARELSQVQSNRPITKKNTGNEHVLLKHFQQLNFPAVNHYRCRLFLFNFFLFTRRVKQSLDFLGTLPLYSGHKGS